MQRAPLMCNVSEILHALPWKDKINFECRGKRPTNETLIHLLGSPDKAGIVVIQNKSNGVTSIK